MDKRRRLVARMIAIECIQRIIPVDVAESCEKIVGLVDNLSVSNATTISEVNNPIVQVPR